MVRQIKILAPFIIIAAIVFSFPFAYAAWKKHNPFYGKWENDIHYYNASNYNKTLELAISRWEETGIGINFKETDDKDGADLVIYSDREKLKEKCDSCLGWALIGESKIYQSKVYLMPASETLENRVVDFSKIQTIIHELGHVLGLGHNREICSTMNSNSFCHQSIKARVDEKGTFMACGPWKTDIEYLKELYPEASKVPGICKDQEGTFAFYSKLFFGIEKKQLKEALRSFRNYSAEN